MTKKGHEMKLILNTYKNVEHNFTVKVTTCNKRIATTENTETGEIVKFNRPKFEWMVTKGIFVEVVETDDVEEKPVIEKIIDEIRAVNESREDGSTISDDDTNEEIMNIFRLLDVDVEDDEDALRQAFGDVGFEDMREAESGCYQ